MRRQKCTCVQIRRRDQAAQEVPPTCDALSSMPELPAASCKHVLRAPVHPNGAADAEMRHIFAHCVLKPEALVVRARQCRCQGAGDASVRVPEHGLGLGDKVLVEGGAPTAEPHDAASAAEPWPDLARRTAAMARSFWRVAEVPAWDEAAATTLWRWAGHAGRLSREVDRSRAAMAERVVVAHSALLPRNSHRSADSTPQLGTDSSDAGAGKNPCSLCEHPHGPPLGGQCSGKGGLGGFGTGFRPVGPASPLMPLAPAAPQTLRPRPAPSGRRGCSCT